MHAQEATAHDFHCAQSAVSHAQEAIAQNVQSAQAQGALDFISAEQVASGNDEERRVKSGNDEERRVKSGNDEERRVKSDRRRPLFHKLLPFLGQAASISFAMGWQNLIHIYTDRHHTG
eukprot:7006378-Prymnesium_polylepis.1